LDAASKYLRVYLLFDYFNIYIGKNGTNEYGDCYYTRIAPSGMSPVDWQLFNKEEFDFFLDKLLLPEFKKIIEKTAG